MAIVRSMANSPHQAEQKLIRPYGCSTELDAAVVLLRQALPYQATVERLPDTPGGLAEGDVSVRWHDMTGGPKRLRLAPWGIPLNAPGASADTSISDEPGIPVVWVLPRASAAQRNALRARGEPFIDLSGAVSVRLPWILVDREDLAPVRSSAGLLSAKADPFADKSSLVLRTLLEQRDPRRAWGVREIAGAAGVGAATASDAFNALAARHLVQIARRGRAAEVRLVDPTALIDAWTRMYDWRLNRGVMVHAPIGDPAQFLRRLPRLMHPQYRWALTLQAGASLLAPHATWDRVHVYVDIPRADRASATHVLTAIAERAGWSAGADGRLVLVAPFYATSAWHGLRMMGDLPVVSDLQLVLDLWHYPLRGREQAEYLLRRMLAHEILSEEPTPDSSSPETRPAKRKATGPSTGPSSG